MIIAAKKALPKIVKKNRKLKKTANLQRQLFKAFAKYNSCEPTKL